MYLKEFWPHPWHPSIAFTGSRQGMSLNQWLQVRYYIDMLEPGDVHHGDCIGSDKQFHSIVNRPGPRPSSTIHVHPCDLGQFRAHCMGDIHYPVQRPLDRNKTMVHATDITIATPFEAEPVLRSGTWSTIRYSMGNYKPTIVIRRDGTAILWDGRKEVMKSAVSTLGNATGVSPWTANATGTAYGIQECPNGEFAFYASGTWDSGSAKLQVSPDDTGSVWIDVASSTMTADGYKIVQAFGRRVRVVLASVATLASLTFKVVGINTDLTRTNS